MADGLRRDHVELVFILSVGVAGPGAVGCRLDGGRRVSRWTSWCSSTTPPVSSERCVRSTGGRGLAGSPVRRRPGDQRRACSANRDPEFGSEGSEGDGRSTSCPGPWHTSGPHIPLTSPTMIFLITTPAPADARVHPVLGLVRGGVSRAVRFHWTWDQNLLGSLGTLEHR